MHKTVSATQARKQWFQLLKMASKPGSSVTITLEGNPPILLLSQEEFEGWMETLEIMSDSELMADIHEGMKDIANGEYVSWEEVKNNSKLTQKKK